MPPLPIHPRIHKPRRHRPGLGPIQAAAGCGRRMHGRIRALFDRSAVWIWKRVFAGDW